MQGALGDLTCLLSHRPIADPAAIDWPALADLALDRHRIGPTIAKAVLALDPPRVVAARFQDDLEAAGFAALSEKAETIRQVEALRARGCDPVLLKGWPLAERLFGSASLRHSKDIDFHLSPERVPSAITCLTEQGYAPVPGHRRRVKLVLRQVPSVLAETNDIAFYHPSGRQIELHWRLSQLSGWTRLEQIPDPTVEHAIDRSGITVSVLSDRANLIYLSQHGQLHMWGRLKWLVDIARLCELRDPDDLLQDLRVAERIGAGRPVRIAVHLAHQMLGSPVPGGWPQPTWLERCALSHFRSLIADPGGEPGKARARLQYHLCVLAFGEGWRQRLASPRYAIWRNLRLFVAGRRLA